jgi:5-methylcytosine-specific restriction endonuclease McrA
MTTTLLLNASYEPLCVLPLKRAVVLVLDQKAEVLEEAETSFGSVSMRMKVPSVIRLTYFVKVPYTRRVHLNRKSVVARDHSTCQYCGVHGSPDSMTIDHIHPRSKGGLHDWMNVVCACRPCNSKKSDKSLAQLGWKLRKQPHIPTGKGWMIIGMSKIDESWAPYLNVSKAPVPAFS